MDFSGIFKIIQVCEHWDGTNKMQIEQRVIPQIVGTIFKAKKLEKKYYDETTELEKWQSEILFEY